MPQENRLYARREQLFSDMIGNLGESLLPGSAERIRAFIAKDGQLPTDAELPQSLLDHLETEHGSRNLKPQAAERTGTGKTFKLKYLDTMTPLERALAVLPLKAESRAALVDKLGYDFNRFTAGEAARAIVSKMGRDRSFTEAHFEPTYHLPVPPNELRVRAILADRFVDVMPSAADREAFARTYAETAEGLPRGDGAIVQHIASGMVVSGRISADDPRRSERDPVVSPEPRDGKSLVM